MSKLIITLTEEQIQKELEEMDNKNAVQKIMPHAQVAINVAISNLISKGQANIEYKLNALQR